MNAPTAGGLARLKATTPKTAHGDKRNYNHDRDEIYHTHDHRPKREHRSGGQSSSASSVTSSIRSQDTEVYDRRDYDSRQSHDYDHNRNTRSRSRDRDSRDRDSYHHRTR